MAQEWENLSELLRELQYVRNLHMRESLLLAFVCIVRHGPAIYVSLEVHVI